MPQAIPIPRRAFIGGTLAGASLLALPACTTLGAFSMVDAVRRILTLSSQRALNALMAPGGFWDDSLARFDVPGLFGSRGGLVQTLLNSGVFRNQLQRQLNIVAENGARAAAPLVVDAIRNVSIADAVSIVRGGPTAATSFLRGNMGSALIEAMVPALGDAMRLSSDPILGQALSALSGVDLPSIARSVSASADDSIWAAIGREEANIRANPSATNDPLLMAIFAVT